VGLRDRAGRGPRAETAAHPFLDEFWAAKAADLSRITVPAYVVASWSDQGLHTRGTFEGFRKIASRQKWLTAHGGKKWGHYYSDEGMRQQQEFFDHFLKGMPTGVSEWPRVRYEVRDRAGAGIWKTADDWPLPISPADPGRPRQPPLAPMETEAIHAVSDPRFPRSGALPDLSGYRGGARTGALGTPRNLNRDETGHCRQFGGACSAQLRGAFWLVAEAPVEHFYGVGGGVGGADR
jgi:hypothetical protein